ncbi:MAG TPA: glycosyl hydrolase [Candidatus Acidoferrales bacterium]|nr:glycosyl hydrolase [Candidatus Acidoferrales bacterium]
MKIPAIILSLGLAQLLATAADPLAAGFVSPPASARPQTWWHWMNGNVTKEGITADLEAMQRVGIGGAQIFNAGEGIPAGPVKFNSPEWHEMFTFAVQEADRLGLELCIHNCAGWSSSGGPWNTPEHSMMHVVTSEVKVTGGQKFSSTLPQPPTKWDYYRDIEVVAFRTMDGEGARMKALAPKVTASIKNINGDLLLDGKLNTTVSLPTNRMPQYIQFEFAQPFETRSASLTFAQESGDIKGVIQASDDGKTFRDLRTFMTPRRPTRPLSFSLGSAPVSARFFRVTFTGTTVRTRGLSVADIDLSPRLSIENVETKDGDTGGFIASSPAESSADDNLLIKRDDMVDLTANMDADGHLDWDAPAGNWTVLRIGYTPQGRENHPAPPEGTGPECDKFSPDALDAHWAGFVQKAIDDAGPLAGKGKTFDNVLIDSYEVGGQNWSANFREEFQKHRGYDPTKYLPAFTGRVVDSPEVSERFLWDVRRTIADLFAEKYYGHFTELCDAHNMMSSIEPYVGPYESLQSGAPAEIPMGEFWVGNGALDQSVKLASSVGHIYGRNVIGTESFTASPGAHGRWQDDPYAIKALGDQVFCEGINRYIFHRFAMQPWTNRWPGMTMGQWGTHFDRTSTWWEQGRAWLKYVTRSQFLLQQGRFVADAAYFDGENSPAERRDSDPALPPGYDFDAVGATVLADATVEDQQLVLKSGMRYRVLILPPNDRNLTPRTLKRISELAAAGLTVVGAPPESSPSLEDFPNCDQEVKTLATAMWGNCDGSNVTEHAFGSGKVVWGEPMATIFAGLKTAPDFVFATNNWPRLSYVHRQDGEAEIYFVSNQRDRFETAEGSFRVTGKEPELWHAETGVIEPAPVWREENGRTIVPLQFDPVGSVFVIFRHPARVDHAVAVTHTGFLPAKTQSPPATLVIHSAIYDAAGGSNPKWVDVTAKVKASVAAGKLEIPADSDFAGQDPALGIVKSLRVEFSINGRRSTNEAAENETLELAPGAKIIRAVYGNLPALTEAEAAKPVDLTKKLAGLVDGGTLSVQVGNDFAGSDPRFGQPKELRLDYSLNGARRKVVIAENEALNIGKAGAIGEPPLFSLHADDAGNVSVTAATPGGVEVSTASGKILRAKVSSVPAPLEISGAWNLSFPPNWGAPPQVTLPALMSWTDSADKGVKYFSGTATYAKEIEIPAKALGAGHSVWLDLGRVKNLAEVSLNGKPLGILWKPPFRVEVTGAAQPGKNKLEVKVTNLWPNRLIGDEQLPSDREWEGKRLKEWPQWVLDGKPSPTGRFTFTTWHHWTKDEALLESGLIGPVKIVCATEAAAK